MSNRFKKMYNMLKNFFKYIYYYFFCKVKKVNNEDVWLISERGNDARDNSYYFYKYLKENHSEIKIKYVICSNSVDSSKICKEDIVEYGSKEHYILFLTAGKLISTHIMGYSPEMSLFWRLDKVKFLKIKGKKIMLQHGITQNNIEYMSKKTSNLDMFICGAYPEYEFILKNFGYSKKEVKYTGFARYDTLISDNKNQILVMPTFRKWLNYNNDFKSSEYFKKWNEFLNNDKLLDYLEKNNLYLYFYPHYEIQKKYIDNFTTNSERIIIAEFNKYDVQTLLRESKLLITDYSSVHFDFAYMKKPVIYYQFDEEKFEKEHYKRGYFDYSTMAFGPIYYDLENLVNNIDKVQLYESRILDFFKFNDTNNCERIYKEIIKI